MAVSFVVFCIIIGIGAAKADDSMNTTQCHSCLEDDFDLCVNESEIQNCTSPITDSCFSAAGRYKFTNGSTAVLASVARGCVPCPNVTEGCKGLTALFNSVANRTLLDCNMVCCKGDLCNNQTVELKPTEATSPTATSAMSDEPTTAGHPSHYSPTTAVLAFATIIGVFFVLI